jgi:hypothetical protein
MAQDEGLKIEASTPEPEPRAAPEKPLSDIPKGSQPLEAEVELRGQPEQRISVEPLATNENGTQAVIRVSTPKRAEGDATGLALLALLGVGAFILLTSSKQQPPM